MVHIRLKYVYSVISVIDKRLMAIPKSGQLLMVRFFILRLGLWSISDFEYCLVVNVSLLRLLSPCILPDLFIYISD